ELFDVIEPDALATHFVPGGTGGVDQRFQEFERRLAHGSDYAVQSSKFKVQSCPRAYHSCTHHTATQRFSLSLLDTAGVLWYPLCVRHESLKNATRLVVKLGTGVLTDDRKQPDLAQMEQLVSQVAAQRKAGKEIVLVTSGAVGAGMGA